MGKKFTSRQFKTSDIVEASTERIKKGKAIAIQTKESFQEILAEIQNVLSLVKAISMGSREQAGGLGQIEKGIQQMDGITEQNSAISEENSASSENLSEQADILNKLVAVFKLNGHQSLEIKEGNQQGEQVLTIQNNKLE